MSKGTSSFFVNVLLRWSVNNWGKYFLLLLLLLPPPPPLHPPLLMLLLLLKWKLLQGKNADIIMSRCDINIKNVSTLERILLMFCNAFIAFPYTTRFPTSRCWRSVATVGGFEDCWFSGATHSSDTARNATGEPPFNEPSLRQASASQILTFKAGLFLIALFESRQAAHNYGHTNRTMGLKQLSY